MSTNRKQQTGTNIFIGMALGLIFGIIFYYYPQPSLTQFLKPFADIFINLLKMSIVPLVFTSLYLAVVNLKSPALLGKLGGRTIGYFFCTTFCAVLLGLLIVNLIDPGVGIDFERLQSGEKMNAVLSSRIQNASEMGVVGTIMSVIVGAFTENPFKSLSENQSVLQVIVFSLLLGLMALKIGNEASPFTAFMESLEKLTTALIHFIMKIAPYGVFLLMIDTVSKLGLSVLSVMAKYLFCVILGILTHFVLLTILASIKKKMSPLIFLKNCYPALVTAFSTSSSSATLPTTLKTVQENFQVSKETAQFVLPLGATINMDGTALYESVAVVFIAQVYGIDLTFSQQFIIFVTATLAAIGAAAIPSAGLVTMSIVLTAVGLPLEGIGIILSVDRILDMMRTTLNVYGDMVGTIVLDEYNQKG